MPDRRASFWETAHDAIVGTPDAGSCQSFWRAIHTRMASADVEPTDPVRVLEQHGIKHIPERVADVGVGSGEMVQYLKRLGREVVGIDIVPEAFWACDGVETCLIGDAKDLEPFDLVICNAVVQHQSPDEMLPLFQVPLQQMGYGSYQYLHGPTAQLGAHHFQYSKQHMAEFVKQAGKLVVCDLSAEDGSNWRYMRVCNA